jgi:hypothetical protein
METERTINKVRMSRGVHTSQMSEQRQFLALYNSKDQLQVTDSKWAEWQAKAAEHAAQRKASPAGGDFAAMLQAALQKAQSSSKGRTRRGVQGAEQQAKEAAQRTEKDPAAKRVRLVKDMGYLSLKRAALLGLLQQQQEEHLAAEVRKLNLAEVTAQLLDARWSTQQLEVAARAAQAAAQEIKEQRQQAKSAKLAPQQPRPQQQLQQQDQQPQPQAPLPSKAPRLARQCMLVQPMTMYKEDSNSDSSSSSGKSSNGSCSDCDDSN